MNKIKQQKNPFHILAKYIDLKTFFICFGLVLFGLLSLYSATVSFDPELDRFYRQFLYAMIGFGILFITANLPTNLIKSAAIPFYLATCLLLILVLFFGTEVYGTKGWLRFGGWSLQPSEFAKISLVLVIAKHLSKRGNNVANIWDLGIIIGYFLLPFVLINLQPDFGTALVFLVVFIGILFWGGFDAFYIVLLIACGVMFIASLTSSTLAIVVGFVSGLGLLFFRKKIIIYLVGLSVVISMAFFSQYFYDSLAIHQKARIDVFINPGSDPQGAGYNVIQSILAVGSGGITGKGYMEGTLTQLRYIPMQWTDFIFSVPAEEFGFIGAVIVLFFLLALVYRGINIAANSKDAFNSVIAFGASTIFIFHIAVNIGMVLGVLPVMGIPLPFLSYGGSSLLSNLILGGLLMNIHRNNLK